MSHEDSSKCEELFATPEEVVTFAQAYFATEFPNAERRGCPPLDVLQEAAQSGALPDAELREHLFSCSDCFRPFRGGRLARLSDSTANDSWWAGLRAALAGFASSRVALTAASSCLVLMGFLAATLIRDARRETPASAAVSVNAEALEKAVSTTPQPQIHTGLVAEVERDETKPPPPRETLASVRKNSQTRRLKAGVSRAALPLIDINLQEDALLRGVDRSITRQRVISLSRQRQKVRLRMPAGSSSGRYTVTVVDAFGKRLVSAAGRSNGRTLTVNLDLNGLEKKKYRLCLEREGEAPDCYQVAVD